jgi:hypothetical protein
VNPEKKTCRKLSEGRPFVSRVVAGSNLSFQQWQEFGGLKEHKTSREELADLLAIADRDLKACQTLTLMAVRAKSALLN